MIRRRVVGLVWVIAAAWSALVHAEWQIVADDPAIAEMLAPWLPKEDVPAREVEALASSVLATEGYFSSRFSVELESGSGRLQIDSGARTLIKAVEVEIEGLDDSARGSLLATWRLPVGKAFRQADWDLAKQDLLARLLAKDYADARLVDSSADIDADQAQASVRVRYAAGGMYRFGELKVEGLYRHGPELVARYNRQIKVGDPYSEAALIALQAALQTTPYFASAQARLDRGDAITQADGSLIAPLLVTVQERPAHRLGIGAGASSNTGARIEATYHTPNFFDKAWALDSGLRLEQKRQSLFADVFLPPDARGRLPSVGAMVEATDIEGLRTELFAFGAQLLETQDRVEQRLSLNWQIEQRWHDDDDPVLSRALVPNVAWLWRRVDNPVNPHEGMVGMFQIGAASKALLSDQDFIRLHGRWQQYLPLGQRDTVSLRAELGYTHAQTREHIPQDYLFRTGGTGTVRGYTYESLGLQEGSAIVGGRYLAVVSGELTHWVGEDWGVAAFVDAGDAVDSLKDVRLALGYGIGGRWRTPAGPIGVDLGYGQRVDQFHLHFSLAIPF